MQLLSGTLRGIPHAPLSAVVAAVLCAAPAGAEAPAAHDSQATRRALLRLDEGNRYHHAAPALPLEKLCATAIRGCTFNRQVWLPGWVNLRLALQQGAYRAAIVGLADAPRGAAMPKEVPPAMRAFLEREALRWFTVDRAPEWLGQCVVDSLRGKRFAWTSGDAAECLVQRGALAQVDDEALAAQVGTCLGPTSTVRKLTVSFSQVVRGDEVRVEDVALTFDAQPELATDACVRQAFQLPPVRFTDRPPFEALAVTLEFQATPARKAPAPVIAKEPQPGGPHTPRTPLDDQVDAAEACVRARPDDASCHLDLGKAMAKRATRDGMVSDRDRAAAAYQRFVELAPNHPLAPKVRDLLEAAGM